MRFPRLVSFSHMHDFASQLLNYYLRNRGDATTQSYHSFSNKNTAADVHVRRWHHIADAWSVCGVPILLGQRLFLLFDVQHRLIHANNETSAITMAYYESCWLEWALSYSDSLNFLALRQTCEHNTSVCVWARWQHWRMLIHWPIIYYQQKYCSRVSRGDTVWVCPRR